MELVTVNGLRLNFLKDIPAVIPELPIEQYHSCPGISRSSLMTFKRSPMHYWHQYLNPMHTKRKPTEEMIFGNALHTWVLEPGQVYNRYYNYDKKERRTKAGKAYYEGSLKAAGNKILLTNDQYCQLDDMVNALKDNQVATQLIQGGKHEHSFFWKDPTTGVLCKARPDIWGETYIADLKTTNDASVEAFKRDAWKYGYYMQCVFMREAVKHCLGHDINDFVFICIEKEEPYAIGCYQVGLDILEKAQEQYHDLLGRFRACQDANEWPGYSSQVIELSVWVKNE